MLWPDDLGWPQDIGALAILDGNPLLDAHGRFRFEVVREAVEARLHLVPRFRQTIYLPRHALGGPLWVDAPDFDIAEHVQVYPVPPPGEETQLLGVTEQLRRRPLLRARPLWEMWFLPGLQGGRIGLYVKVHHSIADGVAGVAALGALLDAVPDAAPSGVPPWIPAPAPSASELLEDNLRRRLQGFVRVLSAMAHPVNTGRRVREALPALRETLGGERAPRSSLTGTLGPDRRLALVRGNLQAVQLAADAVGRDGERRAHGGHRRWLARAALEQARTRQ